MRLDKLLSNVLNISRNEAKTLIKNKQIKVNLEYKINPNLLIDEINDVIMVNDKMIKYQKHIYLMLNKPKGYLSATFDKFDYTILDLIPKEYKKKDLKIVGRLDKDTEGLIILSNDGSFIHELTSPKKHIGKKYYVEYEGRLIDNAEDLVKQGMNIDYEYDTLPGILEIIDDNRAYITIYEGKFHQVKKMFKKMNANVSYLKRIQIANLSLDDLEIGQVRELNEEDLQKLKE